MRFEAVLFDLDGTLIDSLRDIGESMNRVLSDSGHPTHPLDSYRLFVGEGVEMLARRVLPPHADEQTVARTAAAVRAGYANRAVQHTRLYEGVPELLDGLERRGVAKAILSNKPHSLTVTVVEKLLSRWAFSPVLGEREGIPRKPDPTAAFEAAATLGIAPENVLYLGDTPTDMATARSAGMGAVGALWGFRDRADLMEAGAWRVVARPPQLLDLLEAQSGAGS